MGIGARLVDRLDARFEEAVALVGLVVLVIGASYVAQERQDLGAERLDAVPTASPAPTESTVADLGPPPLPSPSVSTTPAPTPAPSPSAAAVEAAAVVTTSSEQAAPDATPTPVAARVVVLSVEAPATVRAGETVTFRVLVRSRGGTPVLTGARFGDGVDGGTPAPCAGLAGPSYAGALVVSHTYATAGTYRPYFVASLPCGPASGAGTTVIVTDAAGPLPTGLPTLPSPGPTTAVPSPGVTPRPSVTGAPSAP